jgi:PAS domain S-box-containing protein
MQPDSAPLLPLDWGPLLQAHPLAHFVYDVHSLQLLAANDAALARYGYGHAEFLALNRADLLMPGQAELIRAFLAGLPASAQAEPQPVWLERTRDGRVLHADVRGMQVLFEGRPARLAAVVDATARAQLAAAAAGARDQLQVAGRMARLGAWSVDLQTRRVQWSDVVCAMHEVPPGTEYDLDAAVRFYPGPAAASIRAAMTACIAAGIPFDLELPFVGAQGTQRWVRSVGAAVRDGSGRIVALEGAQQDITERKRDALALAESRARLAALLDAIPDLWFVIDAELRYAEVSNPQHPALSAPWADQKGRRIDETVEASFAAELRQLIEAAHRTGQPQRCTYEMRTQQGQMRAFECRCVALSGGRTLNLIRDITDLAELERRFRAMAEAAPVGIFMTDATGACTYANAAWQRLYGLSAEAALGNGWAAVLHPEDRPLVQRHWLNMAAAGRPFKLEFRVRLPDGTERRLSARSSPLRGADGEVFGHVGTVVDVTQAREYEALRRAQAVAEETGRRQAAFMSRVSHELRTPLNAILGFGQLLQQAPELPPQRTQAYAGHVVQAGQHMLALVDDLLELQRLEQGRVQLKRAPVDLPALLSTCADLLGPVAASAGVELVVVAAPGLQVDSDERCLRQMVLNLGSNAVKYGRAADGRSRVVLAAEHLGSEVQVTVADRGPGMSAGQLQRLFQPFERLGQETGTQPGSGLGLVITRQLAQLLQAEVTLQSEPGHGTTATVRLPL